MTRVTTRWELPPTQKTCGVSLSTLSTHLTGSNEPALTIIHRSPKTCHWSWTVSNMRYFRIAGCKLNTDIRWSSLVDIRCLSSPQISTQNPRRWHLPDSDFFAFAKWIEKNETLGRNHFKRSWERGYCESLNTILRVVTLQSSGVSSRMYCVDLSKFRWVSQYRDSIRSNTWQ